MTTRLSLIVAMADDRVIGRDGELPWHLPDDLRRFRRLTTGHPIIMGRRTYESIGRPLPDRRNIVLSRDPGFRAEGVEVVGGFEEALRRVAGAEEAFVIGGADLFAAALPRATTMHLTRVHAAVAGDVRFPEFDLDRWRLVHEQRHEPDDRHAHAFAFRTYERISDAAPEAR